MICPLGHNYTVTPHRLYDLLNQPDDVGEADERDDLGWAAVANDPDPPWPDEAWPDQPPPITPDQLEEYLTYLDSDQRQEWFRANTNYDRYHALGLIA